jgi:protein TonB
MAWTRSLVLPVVLAISVAAHAGVWVAVDPAPPPSTVELTVTPPRPAPPPPPATPPPAVAKAPAAPPTQRAPRTPKPVARPATPPAEEAPAPPPAAPPPADFTGTTLTNDSGAAWTAATGNGEAMDGPVGAPRAEKATEDKPRAPSRAGKGSSGPPVVALGDLSKPPRAPNLDDALVHHYPAAARQKGIAGKAVVKARISADGKARVLDVVSESYDGFGAACRRTLDGSRWEPPRDREGQAVDTVLTYTCRFEVDA